jgi:UDP-3-O-[3-hydroxymyristoyl] glucosamine N-acyltransferase
MELLPSQLVEKQLVPRPLVAQPQSASSLARKYGLELSGTDFEVSRFLPLSALMRGISAVTYLSAPRFAGALKGLSGLMVVTTEQCRSLISEGNAVVVTAVESPHDLFYTMIADSLEQGLYETMKSHVSGRAEVSPSASVASGVYVDDDAVIGPGAVVLSGTYVGRGVVIKPNATIGGNGFENAVIRGRRTIIPHAGGVWLSEGVHVGSSTCLDRGMFGEFTYVGPFTTIDNLVHFAHSARTGRDCSLVACSEISGSVILGDGVWIGPNASINQGLVIGDHSYVGTGSVVTRDLPRHSLAYGSPAKVAAQVCICRGKLQFVNDRATCDVCGTGYRRTPDGDVRAER